MQVPFLFACLDRDCGHVQGKKHELVGKKILFENWRTISSRTWIRLILKENTELHV